MISNYLTEPVHYGLAIVLGLLIAASVIVSVLRMNDTENKHKELADRVKSWWVMIAVFSVALLSSPLVSVILFGLISFLAFKEFISIIPLRRADRRVLGISDHSGAVFFRGNGAIWIVHCVYPCVGVFPAAVSFVDGGANRRVLALGQCDQLGVDDYGFCRIPRGDVDEVAFGGRRCRRPCAYFILGGAQSGE